MKRYLEPRTTALFSNAHGRSTRLGGLLTVAFVSMAALVTVAFQGGYFPTSWGWSTLAFVLAIEAWLIVSGRTDAGRADFVFLGALWLFFAWVMLSTFWSVNLAQTVQDSQRVLVLAVGATAFVLLVRRSLIARVTELLVVGITMIATYGLATRLFPQHLGSYDPVAVYRLSEPIGYWNGLAVLCAMGMVLAIGLVACDDTPIAALASAGIALVLLPVTLFFTFSRGGIVAALIGLCIAVCASRQRLRSVFTTLALTPVALFTVFLAGRSEALTHRYSAINDVGEQGQRLALLLVGLSFVQAVVAVVVGLMNRRVVAPEGLRRAAALALLIVLAVVAVSGLIRVGGPIAATNRAIESFTAEAPADTPVNLRSRLTSFGSNGRIDLWRYAWHEARRHPLLGTGAGTFERVWQLNPAPPFKVRDAHTLYLETLAEVGLVGLILLLLALLLPVGVALKRRTQPLVPFLLGAYGAFTVHAGVDWDWELGGITLTALLVAALILASARQPVRTSRDRVRGPAIIVAMLVGLAGLFGLLGNIAVSKAQTALEETRYADAEAFAKSARTLVPWSPRPWIILGEAQYSKGDRKDALESFRRAVKIDDREWSAWTDLAIAARGVERRQALERARQLNPGSQERKNVEELLADSQG